MNPLKTIHVIHATDAQQHLGHLREILDMLKEEHRIENYLTTSSGMIDQSSLGELKEADMVVLILTHGILPVQSIVEGVLRELKAESSLTRIVQILVDGVSFDSQFTILPSDQQSIRSHKYMDAEWFTIGAVFKNHFPIPEKPPIESTVLKKYRPYILIVFALVLVYFFFNNLKPRIPKNVTLENFADKFDFDDREMAWWDNLKTAKADLLKFYNNNQTENGKEFTERAVEALMNDQFVNLEEAFIETSTNDTDYKMTGIKLFLPLRVILPTRDTVRIDYGTTTSDQLKANQEVSVVLVDGIKQVLASANKNLTQQDKIKSIHIMATTNGKHGTHSNHYHGAAVDINRINNKRMVLTGLTLQITQLQKAMDNYDYVRENFGPAMKHKFTLENKSWDFDYKVGGHTDHIHFSVRK